MSLLRSAGLNYTTISLVKVKFLPSSRKMVLEHTDAFQDSSYLGLVGEQEPFEEILSVVFESEVLYVFMEW